MAKIPRWDSPTDQTSQLDVPRAQGFGPDAFGVQLAGALEKMGQVGAQAVGVVNDQVARIKAEEDLTTLNESKVNYQKQKQELLYGKIDEQGNVVTPGLLSKTGKDAYNIEKQYTDSTAQLRSLIMDNVKDRPHLQTMLQTYLADDDLKTSETLGKHELAVRQKATVNSQAALLSQLQDDAIGTVRTTGDFDPLALQKAAYDYAQLTGEKDPMEAAKGVASTVYSQALKSAVQGQDKEGAIVLFDKLKDRITEKDRGLIEPHIEEFRGALAGNAIAELVFKQNQPETMNEPVNVDAMRKMIADDTTLGDKARKVAETRVEELARELTARRKEQVDVFVGNLWQRIDDRQVSLSSALTEIDTADLPGHERVMLKKSVEHYFKPPADPEAKMLKYLSHMEQLAELQNKISNGEIRVKTLADGLKFASLVGRENVQKLVSFGTGYEKALASPGLAPGQFDVIMEELRGAGVKDIPKKNTPEYKAMQATLLDEIVGKQVKTGKMLDDQGVKTEFRRMVTENVPVNARQTFMGIPLWSTKDEKKAWQVENPGAVDVAGILRKQLKREPTKAEVTQATAAYLKKNPTRREAKPVRFTGGVE